MDNFKLELIAKYDSQKQLLLNIWLLLWSLAGLAIVTQFFAPMAEGMNTYLIIWMAFWAYFEYKAIYAYRWRKYGKEVIEVTDEYLIINREIAGRGIPTKYDLENIKNLKLREENIKSFNQAMGKGYWSPGDEKLTFLDRGKEISFGMELDKEEAQDVLSKLKYEIKSRIS